MRFPMIVERAGQAAAAALLLGLGSVPAAATVMPLDLNDFFFDSTDPITVAADGSSATLVEDSSLVTVVLSNVPDFGDPNIIIPAPGRILAFEFDFDEPAGVGNDDEFGAFVLDGTDGLPLGVPFEFFATDTSSGTVEFDLSPLVGELLGMQFQLSAGFSDAEFTSTVTISNLRLVDPVAVPAPGTFVLLLGAALLASGAGMLRAHRVT